MNWRYWLPNKNWVFKNTKLLQRLLMAVVTCNLLAGVLVLIGGFPPFPTNIILNVLFTLPLLLLFYTEAPFYVVMALMGFYAVTYVFGLGNFVFGKLKKKGGETVK